MYSKDDVITGIIRYADNEVLPRMDLRGKIVLGSMISYASIKADQIIGYATKNELIKTLGIVDEIGQIDVDGIINSLTPNIEKYGGVVINIPMAGEIRLSSSDIVTLHRYIKHEI